MKVNRKFIEFHTDTITENSYICNLLKSAHPMTHPVYKKLLLRTLQDIDTLEELIRSYGRFNEVDYNYFLHQAMISAIPTRMRKKLAVKIKPLIEGPVYERKTKTEVTNYSEDKASNDEEQKEKEKIDILKQKEEKEKAERLFFSQPHKASEFSMHSGYISIGDYKLVSKRICEEKSSWLQDIEHDFIIKKIYGKNNFEFVPATDLSFLLNSIQEQKEKQRRNKLKKKFDEFRIVLDTKIDDYLYQVTGRDNQVYDIHLQPIETAGEYFYDELEPLKIFPNDINKGYVTRNLQECNVEVPIEDIKIYNGYILIALDRITVINKPSWEGFLNHIVDANNESILRNCKAEIKEIFDSHFMTYEKMFRNSGTIRINTYMSAKSFDEGFMNPDPPSNNSYFARMWKKPTHFRFPYSYLKQEVNDGYSVLFSLGSSTCNRIMTTQRFSFPKSITEYVKTAAQKYKRRSKSKKIVEELLKDGFLKEVRCVPKEYFGRIEIRGINKLTKSYHKVIKIIESYAHFSDFYGWYGTNSKPTERRSSYLVLDSKYDVIYLCPTDYKYSIYRFYIDTKKCSLEQAAYILAKYFISDIDNKRQDCKIFDIWRYFGIIGFDRC